MIEPATLAEAFSAHWRNSTQPRSAGLPLGPSEGTSRFRSQGLHAAYDFRRLHAEYSGKLGQSPKRGTLYTPFD